MYKSLGCLVREAFFLKKLLGVTEKNRSVALVPPFHIYGFLYTCLLPLVAQMQVTYCTIEHGLLDEKWGSLKETDLVVTVPALWHLTKSLCTQSPALIISSGAPLGAAKEQEFLELKRTTSLSTRLIEVLGSTETGGMGYRWAGVQAEQHYRFFEGVTLTQKEDEHFLSSPFIFPPDVTFPLSDVLFPLSKEEFRHGGRTDRIFKFNGKRYSLAEVEKTCTRLLGGSVRALAFFKENADDPKGGQLQVYLECSSIPPEFRGRYQRESDLPSPHALVPLAAFPVNVSGKTTRADLERCATLQNA